MTKKLVDALREVPAIDRGRAYLCVGPNVWGKAFSPRQAWENARKPTQWLMFDAPPCAVVDEMGGINWFPHLYAAADQATQNGKYPEAHTIGGEAKEIARYGVRKEAA